MALTQRIILQSSILISLIVLIRSQMYEGDRCIHAEQKQSGVCTLTSNCPTALNDFKLGKYPQICGFKGSKPVICCIRKKRNIGNNIQLNENSPNFDLNRRTISFTTHKNGIDFQQDWQNYPRLNFSSSSNVIIRSTRRPAEDHFFDNIPNFETSFSNSGRPNSQSGFGNGARPNSQNEFITTTRPTFVSNSGNTRNPASTGDFNNNGRPSSENGFNTNGRPNSESGLINNVRPNSQNEFENAGGNSRPSFDSGFINNGIPSSQNGFNNNGRPSSQSGLINNVRPNSQNKFENAGGNSRPSFDSGFINNGIPSSQNGFNNNGRPSSQSGLINNVRPNSQNEFENAGGNSRPSFDSGFINNGRPSSQNGFNNNGRLSSQNGFNNNGRPNSQSELSNNARPNSGNTGRPVISDVFGSVDTNDDVRRPSLGGTDDVSYPKDEDLGPDVVSGPDDTRLSNSQRRRAASVADMMCQNYSSSVVEHVEGIPLLLDPEPIRVEVPRCSLDSAPLVVGGELARAAEFPHTVALGWPLVQRRGYAWSCGGSLVSESFVLTAAHCTYQDRDISILSGAPRVVHVGDNHLGARNAQIIPIEKAIKHPQYNPPKVYNDIALLKLKRPARLSEDARPACLGWTPNPGEAVIAAGWGRTENRGSQSEDLRAVQLSVTEGEKCSKSLGTSRRLPTGPAPTQVCAGDDRGGKDTCQGDSGGPLQTRSTDNRCIAHIVGITSLGRSCGEKHTPALYTRVSSYIPFIVQVVWPDRI